MNRRHFLASGAGALVATLGRGTATNAQPVADPMTHPIWPQWEKWRANNIDFDGRVIDRLQGGVSHSEGQGYGMLLAAEVGDYEAFAKLADWTITNLAVRADALLAWRWDPNSPEHISDMNNASDGDLFHAWALVRAAERFSDPSWLTKATAIAQDLARYCIAPRPDHPDSLLLLPAASGFFSEDGLVLNPSYMMPLALREVAERTAVPDLARAADAALALMAELSERQLVPDWVEITPEGPRDAAGFPADAGYEAIRVPLFLMWSGATQHPALRRYTSAVSHLKGPNTPTVLDRTSGAILEESPDSGYRAVAAISVCASNDMIGSSIPPYSPEQPYYPATLHLFTLLAGIRSLPTCFPL